MSHIQPFGKTAIRCKQSLGVYRSGDVVRFANRLIFGGCDPKGRELKMNKLPVKRLGSIVLVLVVTAVPANAFRCGTRVISEGDYRDKVLAECGEPTYVVARRKDIQFLSKTGL